MKTHQKECSEPMINNSEVVTIDNDDSVNIKLAYVTEIYASSDN